MLLFKGENMKKVMHNGIACLPEGISASSLRGKRPAFFPAPKDGGCSLPRPSMLEIDKTFEMIAKFEKA